jgi:preprotein translocase subunit SecY
MQKDGESGRKKIASITRYVTVGLALIESAAMAIGFGRSGLLQEYNAMNVIIAITALTAGSAVVMWIGERITEHGVGNGISVVLAVNILSRLPQDMAGLYQQFIKGKAIAVGVLAAVIILVVMLAMIIMVIVLNGGVRKIPVQYAKKMQGRKIVGGQSSNIPLRVNTAGVIPIIFASSIMETPNVICAIFGINPTGVWAEILKGMSSSNWCRLDAPLYSIGLVVYVLMVIFFAYFYTSITFNPLEISENMKKQGGFVPGIRPGRPTCDYLNKILNYIIFIGACGLTIIGILPFVFNGLFGASVSFGGTSLIIIVSVILETVKQIESQMLVRNYTGFLND